jgi:putative ABC transport system substrate-binding protein
MNNRRKVIIALGAGALVAPIASFAQPAKMPTVAFLSALGAASIAMRMEAFRAGMKELGYVEGKTVHIEYRYADGDPERLARMAAELVQLKVDVIVTSGPTTTPAAKKATSTIPIVMGFDSDPVGAGLVASLARPGGNVTGSTGIAPEMSSKQLQLLKELIPRLTRVAVIGNTTAAGTEQSLSVLRHAADTLKVRVQYFNVRDVEEVRRAFHEAGKAQAEAMIVFAGGTATNNRAEVARLAMTNRLPTIYSVSEFVDVGALLTYGASSEALFRRAAIYVDKILKGAKPADLPVEQPTVFEMTLNLKTAKALGLKIPNSILVQATKVIQ